MPKASNKTRKRRGAPKREVHCQDAIPWLAARPAKLDAIVTSIPEMEEVGLKPAPYEEFYRRAVRLCLDAVKPAGYVIFLQTDRKHHGWIDKSYLAIDEAVKAGSRLIWHKIALRMEPGKRDLFRPGYSHMLCFSKEGKVGTLLPDVIERGEVAYTHAFGAAAVKMVVEYLREQGIRHITDPFVGSGTTLRAAAAAGLDSTGLDIDPKQCREARRA